MERLKERWKEACERYGWTPMVADGEAATVRVGVQPLPAISCIAGRRMNEEGLVEESDSSGDEDEAEQLVRRAAAYDLQHAPAVEGFSRADGVLSAPCSPETKKTMTTMRRRAASLGGKVDEERDEERQQPRSPPPTMEKPSRHAPLTPVSPAFAAETTVVAAAEEDGGETAGSTQDDPLVLDTPASAEIEEPRTLRRLRRVGDLEEQSSPSTPYKAPATQDAAEPMVVDRVDGESCSQNSDSSDEDDEDDLDEAEITEMLKKLQIAAAAKLAEDAPARQSKGKRKGILSRFARERERLAHALHIELDRVVFDGKLPPGVVQVSWSTTLSTTAGTCCFVRGSNGGPNTAEILIASKVCDTYTRLKSTLAHEMCHAAVFLIDAQPMAPAHGKLFRKWGREVERKIGVAVSRCHNYALHYRHVYACNSCDAKYGRHSKSVDVANTRCKCGGTLRHVPRKRQQVGATGFIAFTKANFGSVRHANPEATHREVMALLAQQWRQIKEAQQATVTETSGEH